MAIAEKTLYFASSNNTSFQSASVNYVTGTGSIVIGDMPVSFSSVYVDNYIRPFVTASANNTQLIDEYRCQFILNNVTASHTSSDWFRNNNESWGAVYGPMDFTNHASSSYGNNQGVTYKFTNRYTTTSIWAGAIAGHNHLITMTYTYDTNAVTQSKSIIIPLQNKTGSVSTTVNNAYAYIPPLTDYLVEANTIIDSYFLVLDYNWDTNTDNSLRNLIYAVDSGTAVSLPVVYNPHSSNPFIRTIIPFTGSAIPATQSSHIFNLWLSATDDRVADMSANLYVTYRYIPSLTTRVCNSVHYSFNIDHAIKGSVIADSGSANRFSKNIYVPEPGPITLLDSSIDGAYGGGYSQTTMGGRTPPDINIKVGSQSNWWKRLSNQGTLSNTSNVNATGQYYFNHGLLTASYGALPDNALPNFTTGSNPINVELYKFRLPGTKDPTKNTGLIVGLDGYIRLNYLSNTSSLGIHKHTHNISKILHPIFTLTGNKGSSSVYIPADDDYATGYVPHQLDAKLNIVSTSQYWTLPDVFMEITNCNNGALTALSNSHTIELFATGSETGSIDSVFKHSTSAKVATSTNMYHRRDVMDLNDMVKTTPNFHTPTKLDLTITRPWRLTNNTAMGAILGSRVNYVMHEITGSLSGTISNSIGGSINLKLFNSTDNLVATSSRTGDGTYEFIIYEVSGSQYYVKAYEDATHKGVSKLDTPASNFDISLTGGAVAGEFWF